MNNYLLLLAISLLFTLCSYYKESQEPIFKIKKGQHNYALILFYRYLHYLVYAYFALLPLTVNIKKPNQDIDIYIICTFSLIFTWMFLDICFLALSELNHYKIKNIYNIDTSFHPGLFILFKEYSYIVNLFLGLLFFINISRIIYYYPFSSTQLKVMFALFIYVGIVKCLINKKIKKKYERSYINDFIMNTF